MKKHIFTFAFLFLALTFITPVFAGGELNDYFGAESDTKAEVMGNDDDPSLAPPAIQDANGIAATSSDFTLSDEAGASRKKVGIAILAVLALIIVGGLGYWSWKRSQPGVNY